MLDVTRFIDTFTRPRTLMRAAVHGAKAYRRDAHLKQILKSDRLPEADKIVATLIREEADLDTARQDSDLPYSLHRHVRVLSALVAELRKQTAPS